MIRITKKPNKLRSLIHITRTLCDKPDKPKKPADEKVDVAVTKKQKSAPISNRLNELLASMSTDSNLNIIKTVVMPPLKKKSNKTTNEAEHHSKSDSIRDAVKQVATEMGGDAKQTESELLAKLLQRRGGSAAGAGEDQSLSDLISGMQIDRKEGPSPQRPQTKVYTGTRADYVRQSMSQQATGQTSDQRSDMRPRYPNRHRSDIQAAKISGGSVNLFGEKPLGIFKNDTNLSDGIDILSTWSRLQQRELKLAVTHPPSNYFQKMALWTEQGKLWKFPIDNEQGLDDESKIYFTEHIFLEQHLESWCPSRGPVRHFMELVCVGLSKNPYYSVQQKRDHIDWFRTYFEQKKEILEKTIIQQSSTTATPSATPTLG